MAAHRMAEEIAVRSPQAICAAKKLLNTAWHSDDAKSLRLEATLQRSLMGTANQMEAVRANFEKRSPKFTDRD